MAYVVYSQALKGAEYQAIDLATALNERVPEVSVAHRASGAVKK
jgi:hypothetical protein